MFTYYPFESDNMQVSGSALLRLIQNEEMNLLDLLVRESVQNSLDAACSSTEPVRVDFSFHECPAEGIRQLLELNEDVLGRYAERSRMLQIRDTGTTGLTGDVGGKRRGPGQNLVKLVFEILKSHQANEGAETGGSWGLGKTIYYRIGIGLVFYYSRIRKDDGHFQERLVACLVENEELARGDRLLPGVDTGIAWWGGDPFIDEAARSWRAATTDQEFIERVLGQLNINQFVEQETGTAVLIPFFANDLLPRAELPGVDGNDSDSYLSVSNDRWYGDEAGYILNALFKWYAVRLGNEHYPYGAPLIATVARVNGQPHGVDSMPQFYRLIQALYNAAVNNDAEKLSGVDKKDRFVQPISLRNIFDGQCSSVAGHLAAVRISPGDIGMDPPDNGRSPFVRLFNEDRPEPYPPIISYLRKPGMIVCWNDDPWIKDIQPDPDGKFIVALFVPESGQRFRVSENPFGGNVIGVEGIETLEQYLRMVEKADHAQWRDHRNGVGIVERIKKGCQSALRKNFAPVENEQPPEGDLGLSRLLAEAFLPAGFGRDPRSNVLGGETPPVGPKSPPHGNATLIIENARYGKDSIAFDWYLHWGKKGDMCHRLVIAVATETRGWTQGQWTEDGMGQDFPFGIQSAGINSISNSNRGRNPECDLVVHAVPADDRKASNSLFECEITATEFLIRCRMDSSPAGWILKGTLAIERIGGFGDLFAQVGLEPCRNQEEKRS